jgi:hypothetical protein
MQAANMESLASTISLSYTLAAFGVILLSIGISILVYIEWPLPTFFFDPQRLGSFCICLVYAGFGLLALSVLVEMAAGFLKIVFVFQCRLGPVAGQ